MWHGEHWELLERERILEMEQMGAIQGFRGKAEQERGGTGMVAVGLNTHRLFLRWIWSQVPASAVWKTEWTD